MKIGIAGVGCVGNALVNDFMNKGINISQYDKYKEGGIGCIEDLLHCDIIFLCLPTLYDEDIKEYNKEAVYDVCKSLSHNEYRGLVVLKSTVEPETTLGLNQKYNLTVIHNPEFLTANTAINDFKNQDHIVIGIPSSVDISNAKQLTSFYNTYYPNASISILDSTESELMKLGVNTFYSVKIQFFNELYLLSIKLNISYENVKNTMLKNNWINPMHTDVPGPDGKLSYGGMCFPKDTNALNEFMKSHNTPNMVLNSTIDERNMIRDWRI